jgi:hypothetical protein
MFTEGSDPVHTQEVNGFRYTGITKLEHFASLALQGLLSNGSYIYNAQVNHVPNEVFVKVTAEKALEHAKQLIKTLNEV